MPNQRKIQLVEKISQKLQKFSQFVLIDFDSIPHQKLEKLRTQVKKNGGDFMIVKNTLLKIALKNLKKEEITKEEKAFKGPSALLLLPDDWSKVLSSAFQFIKEENLSFKIGQLENRIYFSFDLLKIANLPSKNELLAKITLSLKAPATKLVYGLKYNLSKLIYILKSKKQLKV